MYPPLPWKGVLKNLSPYITLFKLLHMVTGQYAYNNVDLNCLFFFFFLLKQLCLSLIKINCSWLT